MGSLGRAWLAAVSVLLVLGWAAVGQEVLVPYAFEDGGIDVVPCRVETLYPSPYPLEMTRVDVTLGPSSVEVSGAEPFFVSHGYLQYDAPCIEDLGAQALCMHLFSRLHFELRVNGSAVRPDYLVADPASGGTRWVYIFPAGSLASGVYVFEARHSYAIERQCLADDSELLPGQDVLTAARTRTCTVTVLCP